MNEMDTLTAFVDAKDTTQATPSLSAMRFTGLSEIEKLHGKASKQYAEASTLFKSFLEVRSGPRCWRFICL